MCVSVKGDGDYEFMLNRFVGQRTELKNHIEGLIRRDGVQMMLFGDAQLRFPLLENEAWYNIVHSNIRFN